MEPNFDEEEPLVARASDYSSFLNGLVWMDLTRLLNERLAAIHADLTEAKDIEDIRLLQGEAKSVKTMLDYPVFLLSQARASEALNRDEDGTE